MTNCPPKLRGDLSKWLCEVNTGVYVGNVSSRVRDALWERVCQNLKNGQATLVFTAAGEQRMDFRTHNTTWETVDFDGIKLMRRPLPQTQQSQIDLKPGFSKAAQQQMARKAGRTRPGTGDYTVIDLETTGLKAASDSIIEYGALRVRDGVPVEELTIDLPDEYSGKAIEMTTKRKGTLVNMVSENGRTRLEFDIPSRGIIGLRSNLLTATAGEAVMAHRFKDFEPYKGEIEMRSNGSLIAMETGQAYAYAINKLQDRGRFFVSPGDEIYCGQVVGESTREGDITINLTKSKKLTNMRASGSDEKMNIAPAVIFSLEEALEYIKEDEYVEVTPKAMRLRKILLDETERKRAAK